MRLPRILIAAPASGGGKTTVATGLMAALRASGRTVAPFKVGPDYIDPGYHSMASGRPGRNLDSVMCGDELMAPLLAHGFVTPDRADVAVIEGVMGLFDGQLGTGRGSSAEIATTTRTPVVVVIDTAHASLTHAAVVAGLATFDPDVTVAGVILNRVASSRHGAEVARGLARLGIPVLGHIPRTESIFVPSRHLGLVPAGEWEDSAAKVAGLGDLIAEHVDLEAVMDLAAGAPDLDVEPWDPAAALESAGWRGHCYHEPPLVGIFAGRAFTFRYPETTEMLTAAGFRVVDVDPLSDRRLPDDIQGLYLGGGFPQVHATDLETNSELAADVRSHAEAGMPIVAECAGLLYLCRQLDGHEMAGVLPMDAAMAKRLTMGYRVATRDSISVVGHEFHRTTTTPLADLDPAWHITMPDGTDRAEGALGDPGGLGRPTIQASYLHLHWAGQPSQAAWFAREVARFYESRDGQGVEPDLDHHGDRDIAEGLVDLAVNVRVSEPPQWLRDAITSTEHDWARYPDATPGREALAALHGVPTDMVLPTAGAAEAFPLVAALKPRHAVVIHPQFTEPEAALRAAGMNVSRHILKASDGFALDPVLVPDDADLVIVGNPTNPTGRLHPATDLLALRRPGRILVVDEAFMDATDESQSLIGSGMDDLLVLRSLTKTYGLAGIRAGYVVGDRHLVSRLAAHQTPWSVSTPAIAAMIACTCEEARRFRGELRDDIPAARADLVEKLNGLGLSVVDSEAPFVLVNTSSLSGDSIRQPLAERGFAVRRGETFPGLGPTWIRLAVRDPKTHAELARAISDLTTHRN
ncbi:cobyrinate a,c-diamide synthase [Cutibacterium namnetense]|uniref:Hydrogenobyrinate a,c-diamide synthase n=1 Tax=Cutibacterium namnetense TaxID=1574624 RepID=A0ABX9I9T0_9ACTN|nr:cobyrinate a,c-diamide synthase [Cutibacterium namnetense]REB69554.1 cobyrinic acid a,c-diamide synthase [Cutibacterium namnetense]